MLENTTKIIWRTTRSILKRVETVEKENFYRRIERQTQQLQTPRVLPESMSPFLSKANLASNSESQLKGSIEKAVQNGLVRKQNRLALKLFVSGIHTERKS